MSATAIINEPDVNGERDILIVSADLLGIFITYLSPIKNIHLFFKNLIAFIIAFDRINQSYYNLLLYHLFITFIT